MYVALQWCNVYILSTVRNECSVQKRVCDIPSGIEDSLFSFFIRERPSIPYFSKIGKHENQIELGPSFILKQK